jgi:hypothetical protein
MTADNKFFSNRRKVKRPGMAPAAVPDDLEKPGNPEFEDVKETFNIPLPETTIGKEVSLDDSSDQNAAPPSLPEPAAAVTRVDTVQPETKNYLLALNKITHTSMEGLSGSSIYLFSYKSKPSDFEGAEGKDEVCIDVGSSYYGWNVEFDNGIRMSLHDLAVYQNKHHRIPSDGGVISRGPSTLKFSHTRKIYVYQEQIYLDYVHNG